MGKVNKKQVEKGTGIDWLGRIMLFFIFGSLVLPVLVLNKDNMDPAYLVRHVVLAASVGLTVVLLMFLGRNKEKMSVALWQSFKHPISLAFLAFISVKLLSVSVAINAVEAGFDILSSVVCYLFFIVLSTLLRVRNENKNLLLWCVAAFNVLIVLLGVFAFAKIDFDWSKMGEVGSQMINPNLFAPLFFMCIPFLLIILKYGKQRAAAVTLLVANVLMIIALQNRATYLALLLGLVAYIGMIVFAKYGKMLKIAYLVVVLLGITSGAYLFSQNNYWHILTDRTADIHENYNSTTERLVIWNRSIILFGDNPLVGIGAGNWPLRVGEYGITDPKSDYGSKYFLRPHNELLRILSELGVLGFITIAILVLFIIRGLIRLLKYEDNRQDGNSLLFGFAGLIAIGGLSFPMERVPHMVLMLSMVALLDPDLNLRQGERSARRFILPLLICFSLIGVAGFYKRMELDTVAKKMDDARNAKRWREVMHNYEAINTSLYNVNYFRVPLGFYSGLYYYHKKDLNTAKVEFTDALTCNPNHILTLTNLATCYQQMEMSDSAIHYFERALQVNPNFETARLNLAITYYNTPGKAIEAWEILLKCKNPPNNIRAAVVRNYLLFLLKDNLDKAFENKVKSIYKKEDWLLWIYSETKRGQSLEEILKGVELKQGAN